MARLSFLVPLLLVPVMALSQVPPNAGELLREAASAPGKTPALQSPSIASPAPVGSAADGTPIPVKSIVITGSTLIPAEELHALVANVEGSTLRLDELREVAGRITRAYTDRGYLLARAYLPAQSIENGVVTIAVQEGRLGTTRIDNTSAVADAVILQFLSPLRSGDVLALPNLEDALLRLREVPGVDLSTTLQPGAKPGTADLILKTERTSQVAGSLTLDNAGGDSSGALRLGAALEVASPFGLGDRLSAQGLSTLTSGQHLRYGRLGYDYALGGRGLRVGVAYSRLDYELGQNFKILNANGTANVGQLWVSRPLLRSRSLALDFRAGYDYRDLNDRVEATGVRNPRTLHSGSAGVSGIYRDTLLGGGTTSASAVFTITDVTLRDAAARAQDRATARTRGSAGKAELSIERWQVLPSDFSVVLRARGQMATSNLDSADQIGASGPSAVRAYPQGELYGDQAAFFTVELRHPLPFPAAAGKWQAVFFYDHGTVWLSRDPYSIGDNRRSLAGVGAGLRASFLKHWSTQIDAAWRTQGGKAVAAGAHSPQVWASMSYVF